METILTIVSPIAFPCLCNASFKWRVKASHFSSSYFEIEFNVVIICFEGFLVWVHVVISTCIDCILCTMPPMQRRDTNWNSYRLKNCKNFASTSGLQAGG